MPITTNTQTLSKIDQAVFIGKKKLKKKKKKKGLLSWAPHPDN